MFLYVYIPDILDSYSQVKVQPEVSQRYTYDQYEVTRIPVISN